jgi:hypothetical protein
LGQSLRRREARQPRDRHPQIRRTRSARSRRVVASNEDGCVTLIVTHDSIPEDATNVTAIIRRQVYQHESLTFGHFATAEQVAELNNDVNSMETPDLTPA